MLHFIRPCEIDIKVQACYNLPITLAPKSRIYETILVSYVRLFYIDLKGSEIVENYEKAEKDYMDGMKYKDIAEKYGTTINTVKSWKKRYSWNRDKVAPNTEKVCTQKMKKCAPKSNQLNQTIKSLLLMR